MNQRNNAREHVAAWITALAGNFRVAWFGQKVPAGIPAIPPAQSTDWLGREYDALVFELRAGVHADALAIASGLLRGGGVLLLLVNEAGSGPFGRRLARFLSEPLVRWVDTTVLLPMPLPVYSENVLGMTAEQEHVLQRMQALPDWPGRMSFVLTAARGRGKSALLGMLAARWARAGVAGIRVTAPNPAALTTLLQALTGGRGGPGPEAAASIYMAPDVLLSGDAPTRVLLVDEAAMFPVHQLLALTAGVPRTVFATTTAGFEGSGGGFRLRFLDALRRSGHPVQELRLAEPVRWRRGDPLEDWINRLFLLEAEAPAIPAESAAGDCPEKCRVAWVSGGALAQNETLLTSVVGLLSDAHYRTRPSDLRRWLDDPALSIGLMHGREGGLLGVVLVLAEPGLASDVARAVWAGERRPAGQFLPCVLAAHGAFTLAARSMLRVVRIAVHPDWQGRGLGRRMLDASACFARDHGLTLLGASFGADASLMAFWREVGYRPLRVGFRRETTSGRHAAVVMRVLEPVLEVELEGVRSRIATDWPIWRAGPLRDLEPDVAECILGSLPSAAEPDPAADWEQVRAFAQGRRAFELALPALRRWLATHPAELRSCPSRERAWLESALTDASDWRSLCVLTGESGRAGVIRALRRVLLPVLPPA